jgi:pyruvate kinase
MMDMRGRSIRTSHVAEPIVFKEGDVVEIRTDGADITSTREEIQINYFDLPPVMREGDMVIIGD